MGLDTYAAIPNPNYDPDKAEAAKNASGSTSEEVSNDDARYEWLVAPSKPFAGIQLIGGLFSGGEGASSFRGKVYNDLIEDVTGVSLYQHIIEAEVVAQMADALAAYASTPHEDSDEDSDDDGYGRGYEYSEDLESLVRFFAVCKENGYSLSGWW